MFLSVVRARIDECYLFSVFVCLYRSPQHPPLHLLISDSLLVLGRWWSGGWSITWFRSRRLRINVLRLLQLNTCLLTIVSIIAVERITRILTVDRRRCGIRRGCAVALSIIVLGSVVTEWSFASSPTSTVSWSHTVATTATSVDTGEGDGGEDEKDDYQTQESPTSPVTPGAVAVVIETIITVVAVAAVVIDNLAYDERRHGYCGWTVVVGPQATLLSWGEAVWMNLKDFGSAWGIPDQGLILRLTVQIYRFRLRKE